MVLDPALLAAYVIVATALAVSPGPDVLFVVANGMRYKAKGAVAAALGIGVGTLVHSVAAAVGISAVVAATPFAFDVLRYCGAVYLAYLGVQAIRAGLKKKQGVPGLVDTDENSAWNVFRRGFVTNILNPKVIVFYLALLPQFVNVSLGHVGLQIFLLGCVHIVIGLTFLLCVGFAAGRAASWLANTNAGRWLDGIAGLFFIGLAVRLAISERADR